MLHEAFFKFGVISAVVLFMGALIGLIFFASFLTDLSEDVKYLKKDISLLQHNSKTKKH